MTGFSIEPLGDFGVFAISVPRFSDERGFFSETWKSAPFAAAGIDASFVQDNHAYSRARGTLRGLHYQLPPAAQAKLLRVVRGAVLDVAVDVRPGSPTFRQWVSLEVSAGTWNQIFVPAWCAHGYVTLEADTEVFYKVTDLYSPAHERGIRFDDPQIGVDWTMPPDVLHLSPRDLGLPLLADADLPG